MRIFPWARSIVLGWVTLLGIAYLVEHPLLYVTSPLFGPMWIATAHLSLDALTLAAAGFVAGRFNRPHSMTTVLLFAATLCPLNFEDALTLNVPWLVHLAWESLHNSRFLDSLLTSAGTHVLLFGCLLTGGALSRAHENPVSIV